MGILIPLLFFVVPRIESSDLQLLDKRFHTNLQPQLLLCELYIFTCLVSFMSKDLEDVKIHVIVTQAYRQ
jgi:hypothetical protein